MPQLHKRVTGGSDFQKMKSSFFDCFYVMQPLTNGGSITLLSSLIQEYIRAFLSFQRKIREFSLVQKEKV